MSDSPPPPESLLSQITIADASAFGFDGVTSAGNCRRQTELMAVFGFRVLAASNETAA
jgi:hypothetical protein